MHVFSVLCRERLPRLAAHFEREGVDHAMYASQWFITIFAYSFPFDLVTRVWDMFLLEGWKAVYRVALAVLGVASEKNKAVIGSGAGSSVLTGPKCSPV